MELRGRAIRGVLGYGSISFVRFFLSFAIQIAFARLLFPSAFGILTLAAAILTMLTLIGRWGISQALMQDSDHESLFSTIFWLRVGYIIFILLFVVLFVFVARDFIENIVLKAILLLTIGKGISSLSDPFVAIYEREFKLARLAIFDLISLIIGAVIGLAIVLNGFGVWGLLIYYMFYDSLLGVVVILDSRKYPTFTFNGDAARWFIGFGWSLLFSKSLSTIESRSDDFIIGTIGGSSILGIYTIAFRLTEAFSTIFQTTIKKGIMPTFSRIQDSDVKSQNGLIFLLRMQTYTVVPLYILVGTTATDLITLLFGPQWVDAGPVLKVFAPAGISIPLVSSLRQYYYAIGQGQRVIRIQLLYLGVFIFSLLLLVPLYGGIGGAIATVIGQVLGLALFIYAIRSDIGLPVQPVFLPASKAGGFTVLVVIAFHKLGFPWQLSQTVDSLPAAELFVPIIGYGIITGLIFYVTLFVTSSSIVLEDLRIVRSALIE